MLKKVADNWYETFFRGSLPHTGPFTENHTNPGTSKFILWRKRQGREEYRASAIIFAPKKIQLT